MTDQTLTDQTLTDQTLTDHGLAGHGLAEQTLTGHGLAEQGAAGPGFVIRPKVIWAVVAGVLVLAAVPWVRHQVTPSLARQPEPFSAIAFADPVRPVDCRSGRAVIEVTNHVGGSRVYGFTSSVLRTGRPAVVSHGQVRVADGATSSAVIQVRAEARAGDSKGTAVPYTVAIALDGAGEQVRASCPHGAS